MSERRRRSDRWAGKPENTPLEQSPTEPTASEPSLETESTRAPLWHEIETDIVPIKTVEELKAEKEVEIVRVHIIGGHSQMKAGSAIARGLIGSALLGPAGLLAGASAKRKSMVTLLVFYSNGNSTTVEVNVHSAEFNLIYAPHIVG